MAHSAWWPCSLPSELQSCVVFNDALFLVPKSWTQRPKKHDSPLECYFMDTIRMTHHPHTISLQSSGFWSSLEQPKVPSLSRSADAGIVSRTINGGSLRFSAKEDPSSGIVVGHLRSDVWDDGRLQWSSLVKTLIGLEKSIAHNPSPNPACKTTVGFVLTETAMFAMLGMASTSSCKICVTSVIVQGFSASP